jgi:hypothetical protein
MRLGSGMDDRLPCDLEPDSARLSSSSPTALRPLKGDPVRAVAAAFFYITGIIIRNEACRCKA